MSSTKCKQCSRQALSGKEHCLDHHKEQGEYNYGLDYEIQKKLEAKWDGDKAKNCLTWIEAVTKQKTGSDFQAALKSGVLLCELINGIWPGTIKGISKASAPFNQRENIASYLNACKAKGLRETDLFVTQDLYEGDNLLVVVDNLCALGMLVAKNTNYKGTQLVIGGGSVQTTASSSSSSYSSSTSSTAGGSPKNSNKSSISVPAPKPASATTTTSTSTTSSSSSGGAGKFCGNCGKSRVGDTKFCGDCGTKY